MKKTICLALCALHLSACTTLSAGYHPATGSGLMKRSALIVAMSLALSACAAFSDPSPPWTVDVLNKRCASTPSSPCSTWP
jgi:hypothetical protein